MATLYDILMAATLLGSVTAMMPSPLKSKNWQINTRNIFTASKVFSNDMQDLPRFVIEFDLFIKLCVISKLMDSPEPWHEEQKAASWIKIQSL